MYHESKQQFTTNEIENDWNSDRLLIKFLKVEMKLAEIYFLNMGLETLKLNTSLAKHLYEH